MKGHRVEDICSTYIQQKNNAWNRSVVEITLPPLKKKHRTFTKEVIKMADS